MWTLWRLLKSRLSRRARAPTAAERLEEVRRLHDLGRFEEARFIVELVLEELPLSAEAWQALGHVAHSAGDLGVAIDAYRRSAGIDTNNSVYQHNAGTLCLEIGDALEARGWFARAVQLDPGLSGAHASLNFAELMLGNQPPEDTLAGHRAWAEAHAEGLDRDAGPYENTADPSRRLRIGYISGDFRTHALMLFMNPVFDHHDRGFCDIYCYHSGALEDAVTESIRRRVTVFRNIAHMSDDSAAAHVRADRIDILVDLSGHLMGNRLLLFARKPAPVQITYLAYPATTGLSAIDFRLTDGLCDPPGFERHYSEQLVRLPGCTWCYQPPAEMPEVSPLPALSRGVFTFGSTNNCVKITARTLDLWAGVLRRKPEARMVVATIHDTGRARLEREFAARGIAPERVVYHGRLPRERFWDLYAGIDILLDTHPCNGGTTTCESLWQGVPVVTLAGEVFQSRAGLSVLTTAGMSDWVGRSADEYVDIAVRNAADPVRLSRLREELRARLAASPLCDGPGFVRGLEQAYRSMWAEWCSVRGTPPGTAGC